MKCESVKAYFNPTDMRWHLDAILPDESIAAAKAVCDILQGKEIDLEIKKYSERRSLSMNSYYWVLNSKMAKILHISKARMHNMLLRRYGVPQMVGDDLMYAMVPDTEEAEEQALESETFHIKPTSNIKEGKDGVDRRGYILLKGSSQMDIDEMAALIDGTIDECKQMGIETMTPRELQELIEMERKSRW